MAEVSVTLKVDFRQLRAFEKHVDRMDGPIRDAIKQWGVRYRAFVQRRFSNNSRGGGDWPPLKRPRSRDVKAASRRDAKGRYTRGPAILYNTGTLFRALNPIFAASPGSMEEQLKNGLEVGYGGPAKYNKGGRATISDIAAFHNTGSGRLPKREIIVDPPNDVLKAMAGDMQRALNKLVNRP